MISLKEITSDEILKECIELEVAYNQKELVDSNAASLALAWLHKDFVRPLCIFNNDTMIGFVMLYCEENEKSCEIWQFMLDVKFQGKGYGKAALKVILEYIKADSAFEEIIVATFPENKVAIKLYENCGFVMTDEILDDGEVVMEFIT